MIPCLYPDGTVIQHKYLVSRVYFAARPIYTFSFLAGKETCFAQTSFYQQYDINVWNTSSLDC